MLNPTAGLIALTAVDAVVLALTWREYRQQPPIRAGEAVTALTTTPPAREGDRSAARLRL
ncbi:MAG TPA: hypothetical protein VHR39_08315 [Propionibacteriaceae bacterium]|nr:hypothetical protein [Propionibacteriaceae bacterium]